MKKSIALVALTLGLGLPFAQAAVITVDTVDNINPATGQTSLLQAITALQDGDTIQFNIAGDGPHYIATPPGGYPLITVNGVTFDGYSQPGAVANTNGILEPNSAQLKVVLDSRSGNSLSMNNFPGQDPADSNGYGDTENAMLGFYQATNVTIRGLCFVARPTADEAGSVSLYAISFARGAQAHINGCWFGIDVDGQTVAPPIYGITGFRYRDLSTGTEIPTYTDGIVIGVAAGSADPRAEFNVFAGIPSIPIIIEGNATRISGNFLNVFPDGLRDFNPSFDPEYSIYGFEGNIEIGRQGNNTVIGVDGDGVNDAEERNIIGGAVPEAYDHNIEFYGNTPGTNIIIAGNYIGIGIDGATRFTNGVPAVNASGGSATYRFGSNLDGISDDLEANHVYNLWPPDLFPSGEYFNRIASLNFYDELSASGSVSLRGNVLVNNYPSPASPARDNGTFLTNYMAKAVADIEQSIYPVIDESSTTSRLLGSAPLANTNYPTVFIDVYIANNEGITNGFEAVLPGLDDGFVQGDVYLGSFVLDGLADNDPAPGQFDVSVASWNIPVDSVLTITANYSKGGPNAETLTGPFSAPVQVVEGEPPAGITGIGLNFGGDEVGGALAADGVAGVEAVAQGTWNNLNTLSGSASGLVADASGSALVTAMTVQWTSANTWASTGRGEENNGFTGGDLSLMTGYLDTGADTTSTVTISGIPEELTLQAYDVYVYALGGVAGRGGAYRVVNPSTSAVLRDYIRAQSPATPTNHVEVTSTDPAVWGEGTYLVFSGLTDSSITIEATTVDPYGFGNPNRAPINAVQIVPSTEGPQVRITSIVNNGDGTLTVTWEGGGVLEAAPSITGPWGEIEGATSPFTFEATESMLFGRIRKDE